MQPAEPAKRVISARYYNENASVLALKYEKLPFAQVHSDLLTFVSGRTGRALDIGSGSGRDAAWLAKHGWTVTALEPAEALLKCAKAIHAQARIRWLKDSLPALRTFRARTNAFDLILMSAVWMHVEPQDRWRAVKRVTALAAPGALICLSVKNGDTDSARGFFDVDVAALVMSFRRRGLTPIRRSVMRQPPVQWTRLIFCKRARTQGMR